MSIFRNTFTPTIQGQLKARQNSAQRKNPNDIIYLNSRNSWTRMTSGVNVNGTDEKAKAYVLQGGTLNNGKLRYGVGDQSSAYSTTSPSGISYNTSARAGAAGLKPMPGITSVDIKSKTAYGSLREVTVNFVCHNIQQLEDLELLYMRPGYTVLVEWGWAPFLGNDGQIKSNIEFCDHVLKGDKERDEIFLDLFQRSIKHNGNYDALYGYVKNYSWNARMDGGYDCQTTIISIGEIIESLKIGYIPFDINTIAKNGGLLGNIPTISLSDTSFIEAFKAAYSKNILAGLCHSLFRICLSNIKNPIMEEGDIFTITPSKSYAGISYDMFVFSPPNTIADINSLGNGIYQGYITLESFIDMLNTYVLLYAGSSETSSKPYIKLSSKPRTYEYEDNPNKTNPNPNESSLFCLAHPLQVSIDPSVCLITNSIWAGGINTSGITDGSSNGTPTPTEFLEALKELDNIRMTDVSAYSFQNQLNLILKTIKYTVTGTDVENNIKEFLRAYARFIRDKEWFSSDLKTQFPNATVEEREIASAVSIPPTAVAKSLSDIANYASLGENSFSRTSPNLYNKLFGTSLIEANDKELLAKNAIAAKLEKGEKISNPVKYLQKLQSGNKFFENKDETGNIGNIYLNIDFLYKLSIDSRVVDPNTQELKLYNYLKNILKEVQESIGGVNNFEIHTDPLDSTPRIIDLNYVDATPKLSAYTNAFQIEAHNISGSVRSYSLQSQIFPEQGNIIAIGAQVKGGSIQGTRNALLDFNNNLEDRIIKKKIDPPASNPNQLLSSDITEEKLKQSKLKKLVDSFTILRRFFGIEKNPQAEQLDTSSTESQSAVSEYKTALRDIISYFQSVTYSNTKGRAIIPVKISLTMDGIGGLIIGHLFKIPSDLLPKGYKSDNLGGKLLQTITGLSHKIENGDWTTTIDAYNIITNETPADFVNFKDFLYTDPFGNVTLNATPNSTKPYSNVNAAVDFFLGKGYNDYQTAAIVGALIQESSLNPAENVGGAAGLASWKGDRLAALQKKPNWQSLETQLNYIYEEFNGNEKAAGTKLKNAGSLNDAVAAMAGYERFAGITKGAATTYADLALADQRELGGRIRYAQDILNRITSGEFSQNKIQITIPGYGAPNSF
jgi:hypothetical protein